MMAINEGEPKNGAMEESTLVDHLTPLLEKSAAIDPFTGVVIGELVGMTDEGTPLVVFHGQIGSAALRARSVIDLHGTHIGKQVALLFDGADRSKPIVMGLLRSTDDALSRAAPEHVQVETDGRQLTVTATERLVLRCGKASITLTKEGKLLLQGAYVVSHASGANRIKGGSVEIN